MTESSPGVSGAAPPRGAARHALWVASAACIALATLLPSPQRLAGSPWCIVCGEIGMVDAVLNALLFVPLGVGLAVAGIRARTAALAMVLATILIEALQFSVVPGRDASIGDVLMNTIGGAAGFLAGANADHLLRPTALQARRLLACWAALWLGVQIIASAALSPPAAASAYSGQIRRALGRPAYPGQVLSASLNGYAIPNTRFADAQRVRDAVAAGATVEATIVPPPEHPWWPAPVVRVVDDSRGEVLLVAQDGADLVFSAGTRAAAMRLRPFRFAVRQVFAVATTDTVYVRARYTRREVSIVVTSRARGRAAYSIPVTPASAWRLVSPRQVYSDGSRRTAWANVAWLIAWLVPTALLAMRATAGVGQSRALRWGVVTLLTGGVMLAGLVGIPLLFGLGVPSVLDLATVVLG